MLIYNVTVTIDLDRHEEWLKWMLQTHIPDVMNTGMFLSYRMSRLLGHDHPDAEIYTVQYTVKDMTQLERYQEVYAPALQKAHKDLFGDSYAAFRTVMEVMAHNENQG